MKTIQVSAYIDYQLYLKLKVESEKRNWPISQSLTALINCYTKNYLVKDNALVKVNQNAS